MAEERCKGITKSGTQCRIRRGLIDGYCRLHRDQAFDSDGETPGPKPDADSGAMEGSRSGARDTKHLIWPFAVAVLCMVCLFTIRVLFRHKRKRKG